jgi:hypothetical protein
MGDRRGGGSPHVLSGFGDNCSIGLYEKIGIFINHERQEDRKAGNTGCDQDGGRLFDN